MKKASVWFVLLGVVLVAGILFMLRDSDGEVLTDEEVREIVLNQYPGEISELSVDSRLAAYKVKVETEGQAYEVLLDNRSGEVQSIKQIGGVKPDGTDQEVTETTLPDEKEREEAAEETESPPQENAMLSHEEIKEIALNEFRGTVTELELDEDDGRMIYEVEIENNEDEATIEIDAYTGQVIKVEIDLDD